MQKIDNSQDAFQRPRSHIIWNIRLLFHILLENLQFNVNIILCLAAGDIERRIIYCSFCKEICGRQDSSSQSPNLYEP